MSPFRKTTAPSYRRRRRAPLIAGALSVACIASGAALAANAGPALGARPTRPPNVIVIQADDMNATDLTKRVMPQTERFLGNRGTDFSHYVVATPQCCPSRVELLTGDYAHNNGVFSNHDGYAGLVDKESTLPAWLQQAGYYTAHIGKYPQGYGPFAGGVEVPAPGWDDWFSVDSRVRYYDYGVGINGRIRRFGHSSRDYITSVFERRALRDIRKHAGGSRPLFLELDERSPHTDELDHGGYCNHFARPARRDRHLFRRTALPTPPSFNERDVSDKPPWIKAMPSLRRKQVRGLQRAYRCRLATLASLDRTVGRIRAQLHKEHALGDTVVLFTSDNGVFDGEHRLPRGKLYPYTEAVDQPFLIRVPPAYLGGPQPGRVSQAVSNVDIAPTILDLANATPCTGGGACRTLDGRSLVPLLHGNTGAWPRDRAIVVEWSDPTRHGPKGHRAAAICTYRGVYERGASYVQYTSAASPGQSNCSPIDVREMYNLRSDPYQLRNQAGHHKPRAQRAERRLAAKLRRLRDCSGIRGRDPAPASGHYCQ